jgi:transposase-like protein
LAEELAEEPVDAESAAYRLLEQVRWGDRPHACPHCGSDAGCYFLRPADGVARTTRTGNRSTRRVWKCAACRRQFSVLTGTVLERTRIPIRVWVAVAIQVHGGLVPTSRELRDRHGLAVGGATRVVDTLRAVAVTDGAPDAALAALLRLDTASSAHLRDRSRRRRPQRQVGPSADYGTGG